MKNIGAMNIEPSTSSKCIIYTSKGRIDIELWARELPETTLIFLQSCQDQKLQRLDYVRSDGTVTIAGGNPQRKLDIEGHIVTGHCPRGSVGYDRTTNEWFFASRDCPMEEDRWILIGKVVGESNYVLRRIVSESQLDEAGKFEYPPVVNKLEITIPYFELRQNEAPVSKQERNLSSKRSAHAKVRLSYEDEDEEQEILPLKKIRLPPGIKEKSKTDPPRVAQEWAKEEPLQEISPREKETLDLLSMFQQRQKGHPNILNPQP